MARFRVGDVVGVKDKKDGKIYECKIVKLADGKVKVHFIKWKKSYDEWIEEKSERIVAGEDDCVPGRSGSPVGDLEKFLDAAENRARRASLPSSLSALEPLNASGGALGGSDGHGGVAQARQSVKGVECSGVRSSCSFCSKVIIGQIIVCMKCGVNLHPDEMCLGIDNEAIEILLQDVKGAVGYICCLCRLHRKDAKQSSESAFEQLLNMVGSLVGEMRSMFVSLERLKLDIQQLQTTSSDIKSSRVQLPGSLTRDEVLEEVRELNEREKRRDSIILRGFDASSVEQVKQCFAAMCDDLGIQRVHLTHVVAIGVSGLFRAKIQDDSVRCNLLQEVKRLRNKEGYNRIYVQRDLTCRQRQDLRDRKHTSRINSGNGSAVSARGVRGAGCGEGVVVGGRGVGVASVRSGNYNALNFYGRAGSSASASRGRGSSFRGRGYGASSGGSGESKA